MGAGPGQTLMTRRRGVAARRRDPQLAAAIISEESTNVEKAACHSMSGWGLKARAHN
jgi:hypothetical protein